MVKLYNIKMTENSLSGIRDITCEQANMAKLIRHIFSRRTSVLALKLVYLLSVSFSAEFGDRQQCKSRQHMKQQHGDRAAKWGLAALRCRIP